MLYSDGVSDNLFIDGPEVKECISKYLDQDGVIVSKSCVADCIAIRAYHTGKNPNH